MSPKQSSRPRLGLIQILTSYFVRIFIVFTLFITVSQSHAQTCKICSDSFTSCLLNGGSQNSCNSKRDSCESACYGRQSGSGSDNDYGWIGSVFNVFGGIILSGIALFIVGSLESLFTNPESLSYRFYRNSLIPFGFIWAALIAMVTFDPKINITFALVWNFASFLILPICMLRYSKANDVRQQETNAEAISRRAAYAESERLRLAREADEKIKKAAKRAAAKIRKAEREANKASDDDLGNT